MALETEAGGPCAAAGLHRSFSEHLGAVAVLSPYRAQLAVLRKAFQRAGASAAALADVTFATVDGFQVCARHSAAAPAATPLPQLI